MINSIDNITKNNNLIISKYLNANWMSSIDNSTKINEINRTKYSKVHMIVGLIVLEKKHR